MTYPHQLEKKIRRRLIRGDLRGARRAEEQFVRALRGNTGPDAFVLVQLLHTCLIHIKEDLANIFGDVSKLPSSVEIAELLSGSRQYEEIIDCFHRTTTMMLTAVQVYDNATNSVSLRAHMFIDENFREDITTYSVAQAIACSEAHLCLRFREAYGLTVGQYIRRLRIEFAKALLMATRSPIKGIGYKAGFRTYRTFLRAFHSETRISPQEYRRVLGAAGKGPPTNR